MKKLLLIIVLASSILFPQQWMENQIKSYHNPDEMVTLASTLTYNQAIDLLSKVSERTSGRKIVSAYQSDDPIGIELTNVHYEKALLALVNMKGLIYEIKEDLIVVKSKVAVLEEERNLKNYATVDSREINISAVFFEMNVTEARQRGMDWRFLLSGKGLDIGGKIGIDQEKQAALNSGSSSGGSSQQQQLSPNFELNTKSTFDAGGFFGEATSLFRFFENENLGEIIASPNITVRDRIKAKLQVGSDISIKQRDFSGNVIENFYSTGSIIEVTPYIYTQDGVDYILLEINAERSSYVPDPATTIINKTMANTQVLMLDGEEIIIGGLFVNEDTKVRTGIPFLKDLPWWFFGLRYIFGSDETSVNKKELVLLIKATLVPSLKERLAWPNGSKNPIQDEILKQREKIKLYQFNQSTKEE
ncbi:MAG: type II and III secretion system protein [Ignavibacteriaceae bacterium]|nr:type II and III secretion system protein [Ignavibacteriaceae bacterium]